MARYRGTPEGYKPGLRFDLRQVPEGGPLRRPASTVAIPLPPLHRECLVLIHGFNNHEGEAADGYLGFRQRQCAIFRELRPEALEKRLADVHWPGDAKGPGPFDSLDFMIYPVAVGVAQDGAALLAEQIWAMPDLLTVDFLAHSLGCRLTLEALDLLRKRARPRIRRVCLMAAAVPSDMVEPGGRFAALLWDMQQAGTEVRIQHSQSDRVLQFAFPPGQSLAGEPSLRALGRYGPPPDMLGNGGNVHGHDASGAGHGDYWGHNPGKAMEEATRDSGMFLKLGERPRAIEERHGPVDRPPSEPRKQDPPRRIGF